MMKDILLIVLLAFAIVCDLARIVQYRAMTKRENKKAIRKLAYKYVRLMRGFTRTSNEIILKKVDDYADYCVEHWNDED